MGEPYFKQVTETLCVKLGFTWTFPSVWGFCMDINICLKKIDWFVVGFGAQKATKIS